ncbi:MAG: hypothetical protein O2826_12565 [Chloroflexi bacterium]|nr:hypothetical protein [Chloroflexota bacterium]MDA1175332.1 hypothetical protein [Chloroflexota bacterium]
MQANSVRMVKAGAVALLLWGVLHVFSGMYALISLWTDGSAAMMGVFGTGVTGTISDPGGLVSNVVGQHSANLAILGVFGIVLARMMWQGSKLALGLSVLVLGSADVAFVIALLIPGYIALQDGLMGPMLFVASTALAGWGFYGKKSVAREGELAGRAAV